MQDNATRPFKRAYRYTYDKMDLLISSYDGTLSEIKRVFENEFGRIIGIKEIRTKGETRPRYNFRIMIHDVTPRIVDFLADVLVHTKHCIADLEITLDHFADSDEHARQLALTASRHIIIKGIRFSVGKDKGKKYSFDERGLNNSGEKAINRAHTDDNMIGDKTYLFNFSGLQLKIYARRYDFLGQNRPFCRYEWKFTNSTKIKQQLKIFDIYDLWRTRPSELFKRCSQKIEVVDINKDYISSYTAKRTRHRRDSQEVLVILNSMLRLCKNKAQVFKSGPQGMDSRVRFKPTTADKLYREIMKKTKCLTVDKDNIFFPKKIKNRTPAV